MGILDYGLPKNRGCDHNWTEWEEASGHPINLGFDNGTPYLSRFYYQKRECEKCGKGQKELVQEERMHLEIARTEEITPDE